MKVLLMHQDRNFDSDAELPPQSQALIADLGLEVMFEAMSGEDEYLHHVVQHAVLVSLVAPDEIEYRQHILADCLAHPDFARELYALAVEPTIRQKKIFRSLSSNNPGALLSGSVSVLEMAFDLLKQLRTLAETSSGEFDSDGLTNFCAMLVRELDDEYLQAVGEHLKQLRFGHGVLISAELDEGNKGRNYILRKVRKTRWSLTDFLFGDGRDEFSFRIAERDEAGARAVSELRAHGINLVANALTQSTVHILGFFAALRAELAFYVGCINLEERLKALHEVTCMPTPVSGDQMILTSRGLYDLGLRLSKDGEIVGNEVDGPGKSLLMVTGANQGGKSTFLRSLGQAQLMMQCGMFVSAQDLRANVSTGVFTHFKREEDSRMESGKFVEELNRMSEIADQIRPGSIMFFNESFASTNEREGSEIARHVIGALIDAGVKVVFVTHMFDLAGGLYAERRDDAVFLRAERRSDGHRTLKIIEGEPLSTSYGDDLYAQIFEEPASAANVAMGATK